MPSMLCHAFVLFHVACYMAIITALFWMGVARPVSVSLSLLFLFTSFDVFLHSLFLFLLSLSIIMSALLARWMPSSPLPAIDRKSSMGSTCSDDMTYFRPPPPPYEKVAANTPITTTPRAGAHQQAGMLGKMFNIWKRQTIAEQQGKLEETAMMDKNQVEHAVTLINIATEMDHSGHHQAALDLYMMGIDKMLSAFPCKYSLQSNPSVASISSWDVQQKKITFLRSLVENNPNMKKALETKILEISYSKNLDLRALEMDLDSKASMGTMLSDLLVNSLVFGAVVLKKSPVPGVVDFALTYAKDSFQRVDDVCHIRERTKNIASHGIAMAAELDRQYEIHQTVDVVLQTVAGALSKASAAYAETPGYHSR
ncbi:hypothetical protein BX666DRAFT_347702 [Dichotomocladium elegans]|nr:hypothetical protein BX666DRAFT_347702 [Dichotomocladium elegans]